MRLKAGTKSIKFFMNALQILNTEAHLRFDLSGVFGVVKCPRFNFDKYQSKTVAP